MFAVSASVIRPAGGRHPLPAGFCILYLFGFDLLTGVFVLTPWVWLDKRPGVNDQRILRNWGLVFTGNFLGR